MTQIQQELIDRLAIRKITPKEAFRLMGMCDEDVEKCRAVGISNSALFRMAGNGLVTTTVEYIMEHIYKAVVNKDYITTDERMIIEGYGV